MLRSININKINIAVFIIFLSGCGSPYYREPGDNKETALLQLSLLSKGGGVEKMPTYPFVYVATKAECKKALLVNHDFDHFFLDDNPKQFENNRWVDLVGYRILANKPTVVIGSSRVESGGYWVRCTAKLKFTPESGKIYRFFYDGGTVASGDCTVNIKQVTKSGDGELLEPVAITGTGFECP